MPIRLPPELAFQDPGTERALESGAVEDLLALARRVSGPRGHKHTLEMFKKHFCRAVGQSHFSSSDESWAETDLWRVATEAADNGPEFVVAFCNACEELEHGGAAIPGISRINRILAEYGCNFHVGEGVLVTAAPPVAPPPSPLGPAEVVSKALSDAVSLVGESGAASAIDRAHTALLCNEAQISVPPDATTTRLFKQLRQNHPALETSGPRAEDITKIVQSLANVLDALSPIRNRASLAHPNVLLEEPEAMVALNATRTLFRYVQDRMRRYKTHGAA